MMRVAECLPWDSMRMIREKRETLQKRPQRDACACACPSTRLSPTLLKCALLSVPDMTKLDLEHSTFFGAKVGERP